MPLYSAAIHTRLPTGLDGRQPPQKQKQSKTKNQNSSAIVVLLATELKSLIFNCCTPLPRTFKLRVSRYLMSALCFSHSLTAKRRYTSLLLFFFQDIHFHLFLLSHRHLNPYNLVDPKWHSLQSCTHKTLAFKPALTDPKQGMSFLCTHTLSNSCLTPQPNLTPHSPHFLNFLH